MSRVLCIGDVMLDVIALVPDSINYGSDTPSQVSTHSGGAAGNVASWIKDSGVSSYVLARVGNDPAGVAVLSDLDRLGVEHGNKVIDGVRTGVVVILVDPSGERTMFPETAANAGLTLNDLPELSNFDAVYLSGYALLNSQSRAGVLEMVEAINRAHLPIFYDPTTIGAMAQVPTEEILSWLTSMSTLIMNEEEAKYLSQEIDIEKALDILLQSTPTVIIKRGAQGAIGKSRGGSVCRFPAAKAVLVDSTGAGDSFAGGYIASWIENQEVETAILAAIQVAARCVAIVGARPQVTTAI